MPVNTPEAKQHVHQLIEQLGPDQIAAVRQLLEVMVDPDDGPLTEEDRQAVTASREYFRQNPGAGVSFEQFAGDCGFTMDQIRDHKD